MKAALGFAIGTWILCIWYAVESYNRDMKVCQLSHSFETCHNTLNR